MKLKVSPEEIAKYHRNGELSLFIGAGISVGCGLPHWDSLTETMVTKVWRYKKPTPSKEVINYITSQTPTDIARLAKIEAGIDFNRVVADSLYSDRTINISETIISIVNSGIRHICSLNYDDLLEEGFGLEMKECQSVVKGSKFNIHSPRPIIYHPHGYLPRWGAHAEYRSYDVVLSDDDYSSLYSDPLSWANTIQTSLLVTKSVLFVGLSMQDPNLKRLLTLTKSIGCQHKHYAILPSPRLTMGALKSKSYDHIQETMTIDMLERNVKVHWIDNYDEIPHYINEISKISNKS